MVSPAFEDILKLSPRIWLADFFRKKTWRAKPERIKTAPTALHRPRSGWASARHLVVTTLWLLGFLGDFTAFSSQNPRPFAAFASNGAAAKPGVPARHPPTAQPIIAIPGRHLPAMTIEDPDETPDPDDSIRDTPPTLGERIADFITPSALENLKEQATTFWPSQQKAQYEAWFIEDLQPKFFTPGKDPFDVQRQQATRSRIKAAYRDDEFWFGRQPDRLVFFNTFEIRRGEVYSTSGFKRVANNDLDRAGWRFFGALGTYSGRIHPEVLNLGIKPHSARLTLGREAAFGPLWLGVYAGLSARFIPYPDFIADKFRHKTYYAPLGVLEGWWNTPKEWPLLRAVAGFVQLDGAERSVAGKVRLVMALPGQDWRFGPEISGSLGKKITYRSHTLQYAWGKAQIGASISEIALGWSYVSIGAGAEFFEGGRKGGYAQLVSYVKY